MRAAPLALLPLLAACSVASAPPELQARALEFTPAPGMARIYVYRPDRAVGQLSRLKVAVDGVVVGKLASGSFMALDVAPGRHRVSGKSDESDRGVEVEMAADSAYYFKIWPRMGVISAQSGLEAMTADSGRAAVRSVRMVPASFPAGGTVPTAADTVP